MIVQFEVPTIVMLTKLEERNPHNAAKPLVNLRINFDFLIEFDF